MKTRGMLAAVLSLALLVAACGGGDAADSTTTTNDETSTTESMDGTTTTESMDETTTTESMDETTTSEAMAADSLADVVAGDDRFTTLLAAVEAAGLTDTLADPDAELTVFAPTNEAFEAALSALDLTAEELLAAPDLDSILTYHVLPEVVMSADIIAAGTEAIVVDTVQGESLTITVTDSGDVRFLDAGGTVIEADVMASNGVIHVIDVVLLPPSSDV